MKKIFKWTLTVILGGIIALVGIVSYELVGLSSCGKSYLENSVKDAFAKSPMGIKGYQLLNFEAEQETTELPSTHQGQTLLSCKANVLASDGKYYHILYSTSKLTTGDIYVALEILSVVR